jgi:hypothetical protein
MNNNNNNNSSTAATGEARMKYAASEVSDKVADESKVKRTYGGRGFRLMKRSNNGPDIPRSFGRGGKHRFAGKLRRRSPESKPMMLSWRLSRRIQRGTPLKSPINAVNLNWTPNTMSTDMKKQAHLKVKVKVKGEVKTPCSLPNLDMAKEN